MKSNTDKLIFIIRHGESVANVADRATTADIDLTEKGVKESLLTGEYLKSLRIKFDCIYTSTKKRALDTTKLINKSLKIKNIIRNDLLIEEDNSNFAKVNEEDPDLENKVMKLYVPDGLPSDNLVFSLYMQPHLDDISKEFKDETSKQVQTRIKSLFDILNKSGDENILIVTHGEFTFHMLKLLTGGQNIYIIPSKEGSRNCSITIIKFTKRGSKTIKQLVFPPSCQHLNSDNL